MIDSFMGKYRFLSNFHVADITWRGKVYMSSEHAYQAAKAKFDKEHEWVRAANTCKEAKRRGQLVEVVTGWDDKKVEIMREILLAKFSQNEDIKAELLATGDAKLVEGNTWNDTFWGVCRGEGKNWLGKILMQIREELRQ